MHESTNKGTCPNSGGDLLSCSYCNVSYHNEAPCLDESQVIAASLKNSRSWKYVVDKIKREEEKEAREAEKEAKKKEKKKEANKNKEAKKNKP